MGPEFLKVGESFFARASVADEPTADDGASAPTATPAVKVNALVVGDGGIYGVQGCGGGLTGSWDRNVRDRKSLVGGLGEKWSVGGEFAFFGEIDKGADARIFQKLNFFKAGCFVEGAWVFGGEKKLGSDPVAVFDGCGH